jgi:hypothetical protein
MKAWTIYDDDYDRGFTTADPHDDSFACEIESNMEGYNIPGTIDDEDKPWEPGERDKFNADIAALEIGQEVKRGRSTVKCEEIDSVSTQEWEGW